MTPFEEYQVVGIVVATLLALAAIVISIFVYRKQLAVSLFEKRLSAWVSLVNASEYFFQLAEKYVADSEKWNAMMSRDKDTIIVFQSLFDEQIVSKVEEFWRLVITFNVMVSEFSDQSDGKIHVPESMRNVVREMCSDLNTKRNELNGVLVEKYFKKCA